MVKKDLNVLYKIIISLSLLFVIYLVYLLQARTADCMDPRLPYPAHHHCHQSLIPVVKIISVGLLSGFYEIAGLEVIVNKLCLFIVGGAACMETKYFIFTIDNMHYGCVVNGVSATAATCVNNIITCTIIIHMFSYNTQVYWA